MKELMIIRHARSHYNLNVTEELNSDITEFGEHQALVTGKFLSDRKVIDKSWSVYVSPFKRCIQTYHKLMEGLGDNAPMKGVIHLGLGEYHINALDKVHVEHDEKNNLYIYHKHHQEFTSNGKTYGQENYQDFYDRCYETYLDIPDRSIIITHGLNVMMLANIACGVHTVPLWDYSISNASMTWTRNGRKIWSGRALHYEDR